MPSTWVQAGAELRVRELALHSLCTWRVTWKQGRSIGQLRVLELVEEGEKVAPGYSSLLLRCGPQRVEGRIGALRCIFLCRQVLRGGSTTKGGIPPVSYRSARGAEQCRS